MTQDRSFSITSYITRYIVRSFICNQNRELNFQSRSYNCYLESRSWTSLSIKTVYFPYIIHLPIPAILLIAAYVEVITTARIEPYNNILIVFWVNCIVEWDFSGLMGVYMASKTLYMNDLILFSFNLLISNGEEDLRSAKTCMVKNVRIRHCIFSSHGTKHKVSQVMIRRFPNKSI